MTEKKSSAQDIENLLKQGLEAKNDRGQTALLLACESGNFEKARELISKGANVNTRDNNGKSAITIACESGQTDFVIYLLSNGAEASVLVNSTLLTKEFLKEHPELVKFMTGGDHSAETFSAAAPAFILSSQAADFEAIDNYINNGGNVNAFTPAGQTFLMQTAANDDIKSASLLISRGADINLQDKNGRTALMYATQKGCDKVGELLLKNKADINLQDKQGKTALMLAAENGKTSTVKMLVNYKADMTLIDKNGQNALMIAAAKGQTDIARFLAENHEEESKDKKEKTNNDSDKDPRHSESETKKVLDINTRDNEGNTALMLAARNGHWETFEFLAQQKSIDFTVKNLAGQDVADIIKAGDNNRLKNLLENHKIIKPQITAPKVERHLNDIRQSLGIIKNRPNLPADEKQSQTTANQPAFQTGNNDFYNRQTTR